LKQAEIDVIGERISASSFLYFVHAISFALKVLLDLSNHFEIAMAIKVLLNLENQALIGESQLGLLELNFPDLRPHLIWQRVVSSHRRTNWRRADRDCWLRRMSLRSAGDREKPQKH